MKRESRLRDIERRLKRVEQIATILNGTTSAENLAHARWIREHEIPLPNLASLQELLADTAKKT